MNQKSRSTEVQKRKNITPPSPPKKPPNCHIVVLSPRQITTLRCHRKFKLLSPVYEIIITTTTIIIIIIIQPKEHFTSLPLLTPPSIIDPMGTTAEDIHRGLTFKGGLGPAGLSQNRCLVILEEQDEDCDDDVISEEEDKRLMEGRSRGMNEDHSGVNSSRSSTSTECWMNTYRKLRRASELM